MPMSFQQYVLPLTPTAATFSTISSVVCSNLPDYPHGARIPTGNGNPQAACAPQADADCRAVFSALKTSSGNAARRDAALASPCHGPCRPLRSASPRILVRQYRRPPRTWAGPPAGLPYRALPPRSLHSRPCHAMLAGKRTPEKTFIEQNGIGNAQLRRRPNTDQPGPGICLVEPVDAVRRILRNAGFETTEHGIDVDDRDLIGRHRIQPQKETAPCTSSSVANVRREIRDNRTRHRRRHRDLIGSSNPTSKGNGVHLVVGCEFPG